MAVHDTHSSGDSASHDYVRGTMDVRDHLNTWLSFWAGAKWGVLCVIIIVVFLAIFRTHNG